MSQPLCGAKTRVGGTCTYPAMLGGVRCRRHGGATPQVKAASARRLAESRALKAVRREGVAPVGDPIAALRELASEAVGLKSHFAAQLKALEQLRYEGHSGEQLRAEVALYERALDRSQKFLHDLARLGLDERQVRVNEAQIAILVGVISRGLLAADLPPEQSTLVREAIAAELRLVEAG